MSMVEGAVIQNTQIRVGFEQRLEASEVEFQEGIWRIRAWQPKVGRNANGAGSAYLKNSTDHSTERERWSR